MIIDVVIIIVMAIAFMNAYKQGILYMAFFFAGLFFGIFASLKFSTVTSMYLQQWLEISPNWLPIISLVVTFLLVFILLRWIANIVKGFLKVLNLNFINQLAGGALGAVAAFAIISIGIWYAVKIGFLKEEAMVGSQVYPYMVDFAPVFIEQISNILPFMKNLMNQLSELFEQHQQNIVE